MGRDAKYHTQAERKAARRAQKARYARSQQGMSTRAAARSRAQERAAQTQEAGPADIVIVPDAMREYANRPFVMSFAFRELTGPALGLQKAPFTFRLPDTRSIESLGRRGSQDTLNVKLETLQFAWAIEAAHARRTEWLVRSTEEVVENTEAELRARICAWTQMQRRSIRAGVETEIWEIAMRWGARRAIMLAEDLEHRRPGRNAFIEARLTGTTPLQKLVKENNRRIQELPVEVDSDEE